MKEELFISLDGIDSAHKLADAISKKVNLPFKWEIAWDDPFSDNPREFMVITAMNKKILAAIEKAVNVVMERMEV